MAEKKEITEAKAKEILAAAKAVRQREAADEFGKLIADFGKKHGCTLDIVGTFGKGQIRPSISFIFND